MFYLTFDIHPMAEFGFIFFCFFFLELICCYFNPFLSILRVCLVTQSCPTLCDPWNPPGSSVHGIFQARTVEWVAISYTRRSSWTRESNPSLLLWWIDSLSLYHLGSPLGQRVPCKNLKDEEGKKPTQFLTLLSTNILFVIY